MIANTVGWIESAFTGAALGIGGWALDAVLHGPAVPVATWLLAGALAASAALPLQRLLTVYRSSLPDAPIPRPRRITIAGGGFAGVSTAQHLEALLGADGSVDITLVSDTNALLFTPMLAEVAASSIEPTHISTPVRSSLRRTTVVRGRIQTIDPQARAVVLEDGQRLESDHLVLALGSVANFFGNAAIETHALRFRTLGDAIRIRNRVIDLLERADREPGTAERRKLLTFVVAGGGFAGAELAGGLNDFARGALADYPRVTAADIAVILVHAGTRILPELSASLAEYARQRMALRGVQFRLGRRVSDAGPERVGIDDGESIAAGTLIWTAGVKPNPLGGTCGLPVDRRGALVTDATFAVAPFSGVWALGDGAAVIDPTTGSTYPPTAQVAIRQAAVVARNVVGALRGEAPRAPSFASLGALCVVGHRTACAELRLPLLPGGAVRFSGTFAWLLWRAIYLGKLPGFERKVRVLFDWGIELFFPRDIVQTLELS